MDEVVSVLILLVILGALGVMGVGMVLLARVERPEPPRVTETEVYGLSHVRLLDRTGRDMERSA